MRVRPRGEVKQVLIGAGRRLKFNFFFLSFLDSHKAAQHGRRT
jgi:hypothetical protein